MCIAAERGKVCAHFGHCEEFSLFEVREGDVEFLRNMPNPGHTPGALPPLLKNWGVTHVISGGMGNRAVGLFRSMGIEVITGAQGEVEEVARRFVRGDLVSEGNVCEHPEGHGEGRCR